ncbi:MAG TPA: hypothetical protein DFR83_20860 [Deltaproteobacteria bacterium]|nr:hypothetical protein [Deltaproteobacteria bacterium]
MRASIDDRVEQTQWDSFWLPSWAAVIDRPELRYMRSDVDQSVLNMVTRIRAPHTNASLATLVEEVDRAHRGVTSTWLLAPRSQLPGLPTLLKQAGWHIEPIHHLRTLPVDTPLSHAAAHLEVRQVLHEQTLIDCIRAGDAAFDKPTATLTPERLADELQSARQGRVNRFVVYDRATGTPISSAGVNLYPQQGIGFLWGGGTIAEHRGRGAYRALVRARQRCARAAGCTHLAVYANAETSDPILASLGFERHSTLQIWRRPPTP